MSNPHRTTVELATWMYAQGRPFDILLLKTLPSGNTIEWYMSWDTTSKSARVSSGILGNMNEVRSVPFWRAMGTAEKKLKDGGYDYAPWTLSSLDDDVRAKVLGEPYSAIKKLVWRGIDSIDAYDAANQMVASLTGRGVTQVHLSLFGNVTFEPRPQRY